MTLIEGRAELWERTPIRDSVSGRTFGVRRDPTSQASHGSLVVALLLACLTVASGTPFRLLRVSNQPATRETLVRLGVRLYGMTEHYLITEDAAGVLSCDPAATAIELTSTAPAYLVFLPVPSSQSSIFNLQSSISNLRSPILFRDGNMLLAQLTDQQRQELARLGCEFYRIPDEPFPIQSVRPSSFIPHPSSFLPDTFIQRLVNKVKPDSIRVQIQRLQDFRTRSSPTESCRAAEQYIFDYFSSLGLDSVALDLYTGSGGTWRNPVGTIRGRVNPNALIIICGHMDATSEDPNNLAPGAEDNGSGTAMAMEAARVLAGENLDYTVKFIGFTGEEQGLLGSTHYAQMLRNQGVNIVGVLNFDMVAWPGGDWGTQIVSDSASEPIARLEDQMAALYTNLAHRVNVRVPLGSDQYPFQLQGYPAIAAIEYGHIGYQWYHTTGDTLGNISMPLAAEVAKMGVATIVALMAIPAAPGNLAVHDAGTGTDLDAGWSVSPHRDLAGYRLFWGPAPHGYTDSLTIGHVTSYRIGGLQSGTRYYVTVRALDSLGNESSPAWERSAVPAAVPLAPSGVAALPFWFGMGLTWRRNNESDLAGYNLYATTDTFRPFQRRNASLLSDTVFRDSALMSDTIYYYRVTAEDRDGHESQYSTIVRGKAITLDQGILLVDETRNGNGQPGMPNDAQVDSFYHYILQGFHYTDWDVTRQGSPLAGDVGPYSTIVWHGDDTQEPRIAASVPGVENYLSFGGRLWLVGWKPTYALLSQVGSYPYSFHAGQFSWDYLHLAQARMSGAQDFVAATGIQGYPNLTVDSSKTLSVYHGRLPWIEVLVPRDADTILKFVSYAGDTAFDGKPVAVRWLNGPHKTVFFGFPLYYTREDEARQVALRVMQDLGEPYAIAESPRLLPSGFAFIRVHSPSLSPSEARIEFALSARGPVRLAIYDITGKLIRQLVKGVQDPGRHTVIWNARDDKAELAPPGVYLCRLTTSTGSLTTKLQLLRP